MMMMVVGRVLGGRKKFFGEFEEEVFCFPSIIHQLQWAAVEGWIFQKLLKFGTGKFRFQAVGKSFENHVSILLGFELKIIKPFFTK